MIYQLLNLLFYCCYDNSFVQQSLELYFDCKFKLGARREYLAVPFWLWWARKGPPCDRNFDKLEMNEKTDDICWFFKWSDAMDDSEGECDMSLLQNSVKGFLNHNNEEIAFSEANKLVRMLREGTIESTELLAIYKKRFQELGGNANMIVPSYNFKLCEQAEDLAKRADTDIMHTLKLKKSGEKKKDRQVKPLRCLHGLPITMWLPIETYDANDKIDKMMKENFEKSGAILFLCIRSHSKKLKLSGFTPLSMGAR